MLANIPPGIRALIVRLSGCGFLRGRYISRNTGVSTGGISKGPLSCLGDRNSYPKAIWASAKDEQIKGRPCPHQNHEKKQVSLIVDNPGRDDQANWTSYFCPYGPKTFASSWQSINSYSQMSQTDSWSSPPTPNMGTQARELEPSKLVSCNICWWVQVQPLPLWWSCPSSPAPQQLGYGGTCCKLGASDPWNTVECRCYAVQNNMILHTEQQWLR